MQFRKLWGDPQVYVWGKIQEFLWGRQNLWNLQKVRALSTQVVSPLCDHCYYRRNPWGPNAYNQNERLAKPGEICKCVCNTRRDIEHGLCMNRKGKTEQEKEFWGNTSREELFRAGVIWEISFTISKTVKSGSQSLPGFWLWLRSLSACTLEGSLTKRTL